MDKTRNQVSMFGEVLKSFNVSIVLRYVNERLVSQDFF